MQLEVVRELFSGDQDSGNQLDALVYSAVYLKVFIRNIYISLFIFSLFC